MVEPIDAVYDFANRSKVPLFRGLVETDLLPRAPGLIEMRLEPEVDVRFRLVPESFALPGETAIRFRRRGVGLVELDAFLTSSQGIGTLKGEGSLGGDTPLDHVVIHWLNIPQITPGGWLSKGGKSWIGRWSCSAAGWDLTLDARSDLHDVIQGLRGSARSALTHVAQLRRTNGVLFTADEVRPVLFGFQMAISCALGRWVAPALPVGVDAAGSKRWEQWASWRCDHLRGQMGWADLHQGDDLRSFVAAFMEHWCDPGRTDAVRYFTHHLLAANNPGVTVEGRIMLVQAAMEYLGWTSQVLSGEVRRADYENSRTWPASEKLRTLLTEAGIPTAIPSDCLALQTLAVDRSLRDGPETIVKVRNMLVHPKDANEPYRIDRLVAEAWHLSLQWGNLLLLSWLGYRGAYQPWTFTGTTAHTPSPVPWV